MHNFTHEDFINQLSKTSSDEEAIALQALLKDDLELQKIYEEVDLQFSLLVDIKNEASETTISKLIHYAKNVSSRIHLN